MTGVASAVDGTITVCFFAGVVVSLEEGVGEGIVLGSGGAGEGDEN